MSNAEEKATPESLENTQNLPTMERRPSLILERLSKEDEEHRATLLMKLHNGSASSHLQAYFEELKKGSPTWDIDTFIEGAIRLANLVGSDRVRYYGETLKGIHYPNPFTELWNQIYPQQPITVWDRDIRYQCPPSWSNDLKEFRHVLSYQGEAPLSHGLNELLQGPTTLDCGMFCQLLLWMAIRYLIGDGLFNELFKFKKGQFILTQNWDEPVNDVGTIGNLLYPFYDHPLQAPESQTRIHTKTVFNDEAYLAKHPGGEGRLHNVIQIDGYNSYNIVFDPGAPRNILADAELETRSLQAYNAPRSLADEERLWFYANFPDFVHPDFAPKNWGVLAEEAKKFADHILTETEWKDRRSDREKRARGMHLTFNFQRLISSIEEAQVAYSNGALYDVLSRAEKAKAAATSNTIDRLLSKMR